MLNRLDTDRAISTAEEFDQALLQSCQAKNSLVRHFGYAPEQIVLGKSIRIPASNASDETATSHTLADGDDLEAERHKSRLELCCKARQAFLEADNSQTIRRAMLRRSNPVRGPYTAGQLVLYWLKKKSPNRLAAGRWHGPAKVICQEGSSTVWISHGPKILRCAPKHLRPASLREWQSVQAQVHAELPLGSQSVGGASTFIDLHAQEQPLASVPTTVPVDPTFGFPAAPSTLSVPGLRDSEVNQPEQELTRQVSHQEVPPSFVPLHAGVERNGSPSEIAAAAPPSSVQTLARGASDALPSPSDIPEATEACMTPEQIPLPQTDDEDLQEANVCQDAFLTSQDSGLMDAEGNPLLNITSVSTGPDAHVPPLAEDNLPFVESPLICQEHRAYCLEIPLKAKDIKRWARDPNPEQIVTLAPIGKRARAEVSLKDLLPQERTLFEAAKQKEIQCCISTSAIRSILRSRLNPEQILKSRWVLTWKAPEEAGAARRAKARLVVLGYQDPKLVEVMRDAPTLSKEGRSIVLQTIASMNFHLQSFDIKTAFLRGKADEANPLAMEPPAEIRKALAMQPNEVCLLLGNAYGRVDAPLLVYKELTQQLEKLGFTRHPLEPSVFLLYSGSRLIIGMHVDDGVCGGDSFFQQKVAALEEKLR